MTGESLDRPTDAELVGRYESVRSSGRTPGSDLLLREITMRARFARSVDDPGTGVSYTYDDASESVVRSVHAPAVVAAKAAEMRRLKQLGLSLGRTAIEGPMRAV